MYYFPIERDAASLKKLFNDACMTRIDEILHSIDMTTGTAKIRSDIASIDYEDYRQAIDAIIAHRYEKHLGVYIKVFNADSDAMFIVESHSDNARTLCENVESWYALNAQTDAVEMTAKRIVNTSVGHYLAEVPFV